MGMQPMLPLISQRGEEKAVLLIQLVATVDARPAQYKERGFWHNGSTHILNLVPQTLLYGKYKRLPRGIQVSINIEFRTCRRLLGNIHGVKKHVNFAANPPLMRCNLNSRDVRFWYRPRRKDSNNRPQPAQRPGEHNNRRIGRINYSTANKRIVILSEGVALASVST